MPAPGPLPASYIKSVVLLNGSGSKTVASPNIYCKSCALKEIFEISIAKSLDRGHQVGFTNKGGVVPLGRASSGGDRPRIIKANEYQRSWVSVSGM